MEYLENHQILSSNNLDELREILSQFNKDTIDAIGRDQEISADVRAVNFSGLGLQHVGFGDANGAAVVFIEIKNALVEVDEPFLVAAHHLFFLMDGVNRTGPGADPAVGAKAVGAEVVGAVGHQRHVGHHIGQPEQ